MTEKDLDKLTEVYSCFEDELSREIYENRIMYSLTNADSYKYKIIKSSKVTKLFMKKMEDYQNKPVLVYGAGRRGKTLIESFDYDYKCLIDKNKAGGYESGIPIISLQDARERYPDSVVILTNKLYNVQIKQQLIDEGIDEKNILNLGEMTDVMMKKMYFDLPQLPHVHQEVFVDLGGFDGCSSIGFMNWCNKDFKHIYIFEPDTINGVVCREIMNKTFSKDSFTYIEKGAWNKIDNLPFEETGDSGSRINSIGKKMIPVTTLDKELKTEKVTFIKMDIEGAEYEALEGAEEIIKMYLPKLAISVYHKKSDIFKIPQLIRSFSDKYIFYLRHYGFSIYDTVLYAIPV